MLRVLLVALMALQGQVPLIDLVAEPSRRTELRSISASGGGLFDAPLQPKVDPPMAVKLESVFPSPTRPEVRIVEVLVTNVSGEPYSLPVGRDGDATMKPGNRGRCEMWLWLRSPRRKDDPLGTLGGGARYASADTKGSFLTLPTGGSVRVRFPVDLKLVNGLYTLKEAGVASVEVHAVWQDQCLADSRTDTDYIVRDVQVRSENTLKLRLD